MIGAKKGTQLKLSSMFKNSVSDKNPSSEYAQRLDPRPQLPERKSWMTTSSGAFEEDTREQDTQTSPRALLDHPIVKAERTLSGQPLKRKSAWSMPAIANKRLSLGPETNKSVEPKVARSPLVLTEEQQTVLDVARAGQSVFFTGSAGTGKSMLLKEIIGAMYDKYNGDVDMVAVTASTGKAALQIGGKTLHKFAGVGLGYNVANLSRSAKFRWTRVQVLIIDEVSMIDGRFFSLLDEVARSARPRQKNKVFGGIQLIVTGDFYQLPPVAKDGKAAQYAFETDVWKRAITKCVLLKKVFRQHGDPGLVAMLEEMREGSVSKATQEEFQGLERPLEGCTVELYPTRAEVDRANNWHMSQLKGQARLFKSIDHAGKYKEEAELFYKELIAPSEVYLKVGASVMLLKNLEDACFVNGLMGEVVGFTRDSVEEFLKENEPLFYEKASTVCEKDVKRFATFYRLMVEMADCESLSESAQQQLNQIPASWRDRLPKCAARLRSAQDAPGTHPVVMFNFPNREYRIKVVGREEFRYGDPKLKSDPPMRVQYPLMLAWAMSIHKSQGQTLHSVKVNLNKVFEKGQAYVAVSRAVSRQGLQVMSFDPRRVFADPRVISFYKTLAAVSVT